MLDIPAKTIYIDPRVREQPNCAERLDRMLPHFQCGDIRDLDANAYEQVKAISSRRHGKDDFGDDTVVAFVPWDQARLPWYYHFRNGDEFFSLRGGFCQSALELNLVSGCVFRCAYCGFGRRLIFSLDVERFMDGLDEQFAKYPRQSLYKFSNMTDLPPFEPELDALPPVVERFAREEGRYVMLFTKGDNVDFLLGLDHRGHTVISWSLSSHSVSREIEKRTATMQERIAAMAKAQAAGYLVRARLSPIVPVRDWREEYRHLFETLFAQAKPDVVTLELLGWFDFEDLPQLMPLDLLDPDAVADAEAAADELKGQHQGPFTAKTHQEVYEFCVDEVKRISPNTPMSVCHGTPAVWSMLTPKVGMTPTNYLCNCGPTSTPGNPLYDQAHGPNA